MISQMLSTLKASSLRQHIIPQTWNFGYKVYAARNDKSSYSQDRPRNEYDLALVSKCIRQWREQAAMVLKNRSHTLVEATGVAFSRLGSQLNRLSGYEEIEACKKKVIDQEARMAAARLAAREAKVAYDQAVARRSNSQREVNELLHRKSNWNDGDVSQFTALVRQDHIFEQKEATTKFVVHETEDAVEREFSELMRSILARYHEEQIWSDKIRSASTYGSLGALALNLLIFTVAVVVVEPWKRRQLTQAFEKRAAKIGLDNAALLEKGLKEMDRRLEEQRVLLLEITTQTAIGSYTSADVSRRSAKDVWQAVTATTAVAGLLGWLVRWCFGN